MTICYSDRNLTIEKEDQTHYTGLAKVEVQFFASTFMVSSKLMPREQKATTSSNPSGWLVAVTKQHKGIFNYLAC